MDIGSVVTYLNGNGHLGIFHVHGKMRVRAENTTSKLHAYFGGLQRELFIRSLSLHFEGAGQLGSLADMVYRLAADHLEILFNYQSAAESSRSEYL